MSVRVKFAPRRGHVKFVPLLGSSTGPSTVTLKPGMNEFDDAEWLKLKPHLKAELLNGTVKVFSATGASEVDPTDLSIADALEYLKGVTDLDALSSWYEAETRSVVRTRISARIDSLAAAL